MRMAVMPNRNAGLFAYLTPYRIIEGISAYKADGADKLKFDDGSLPLDIIRFVA